MADFRPDDSESTERLLRSLAAAMAPEASDPPAASIQAVRRAATERQARLAGGDRVAWRRRVALVSSITTAVVMGGGSVAWARPVLPTPLRAVARAVGLPVDSAQVADVRSDTVALQRAIGRQDAAEVERDLGNLNRSSARLAPDEWTRLAPRITEVERQAEAMTAPRNPQPTQTPPSAAPPSVTEPEHQPDTGPVPTTSDDGRRDGTEGGPTAPPSAGSGSSASGGSSAGAPTSGGETSGTPTAGSDGSSTTPTTSGRDGSSTSPTTSGRDSSGTSTSGSDGASTGPTTSGSDGSGGPPTTVQAVESPSAVQSDS